MGDTIIEIDEVLFVCDVVEIVERLKSMLSKDPPS
jgi:hypothetical protein